MLDAILFTIRSVSMALGIYLSIPVPFTSGITIHVYDIVVFLFALSVFWRLLAVILTKSVSTPMPKKKVKKGA